MTLAKALRLTQPYVSDVACGSYRTIAVQNAWKFAAYFGCRIEDFSFTPPTVGLKAGRTLEVAGHPAVMTGHPVSAVTSLRCLASWTTFAAGSYGSARRALRDGWHGSRRRRRRRWRRRPRCQVKARSRGYAVDGTSSPQRRSRGSCERRRQARGGRHGRGGRGATKLPRMSDTRSLERLATEGSASGVLRGGGRKSSGWSRAGCGRWTESGRGGEKHPGREVERLGRVRRRLPRAELRSPRTPYRPAVFVQRCFTSRGQTDPSRTRLAGWAAISGCGRCDWCGGIGSAGRPA